jgi:hypothetical protein
MSRITLALSLALSLAVVFLGSIVSAQVINGCAKTKNGALRIVADPADCTSRETPISWNQVGPQGAPGVDGVDGVDGEPGPQGEPGPEGPAGPSLRVFDALGTELGWLVNRNTERIYRVFLESINAAALFGVSGGLLADVYDGVYFNGLDCTGQAFVSQWFVGSLVIPANVPGWTGRLFVGREGVPRMENVELVSVYNTRGACENEGGGAPYWVIPADEVTLEDLGLDFPLPAPLYVDLAPEPVP